MSKGLKLLTQVIVNAPLDYTNDKRQKKQIHNTTLAVCCSKSAAIQIQAYCKSSPTSSSRSVILSSQKQQRNWRRLVRHSQQEAQLSQRCRAMFPASLLLASIVQYLERSLLLLVTSTSDLPIRTMKFCSVLFVCRRLLYRNKQDSMMRDSLCNKRTSTLNAIN